MRRPIHPKTRRCANSLAGFARERVAGPGSLPAAYGLLREFTGLLSAARARLQEGADEALEAEEARYAQTTDGAWLAEREAYHKSLVEARYVAARSRLVETLAALVGRRAALPDGRRGQKPFRPKSLALARTPVHAPRSCGGWRCVEELRQNMDRNIQEALALEVAFLRVFGA